MVESSLVIIDEVEIALPGPPGVGFTNAEKIQVLADIDALEADMAAAQADITALEAADLALDARLDSLETVWIPMGVIDNNGVAIPSGQKFDWLVPRTMTVVEWALFADVSGSVSLEFWMDTQANYPPTAADLKTGTTGTNNPRISSALKNSSTTLTGWTTLWTGGNVVRVNVAALATSITRVMIAIRVTF